MILAQSDPGEYEALFSHSSHLRLFRTSLQFLGIGSESVLEGDSIWIVAGVRVPLMLREGTPGVFRIVGGAYVHGFMDGEALNLGQSMCDITII